ncbi:hypothetical protein K461DRAFT_312322 [Myriangium duriaei CBS 260.36]|uniref:Phytanoyl-CoA dioxygenase n=1 Tax=Myriangium duriaei CBS 260.36 TaxID=1168546 RepID=A0A9P4MIL8_9PEZI|nr:hypothetical protein K461DRAFT_312322 [Myriangium duriaei CBS 260.36]
MTSSKYASEVVSVDLPRVLVEDGSLADHQIGLLEPEGAEISTEEIRQRLRDNGFVFLKGLLPREDVLRARDQFFGGSKSPAASPKRFGLTRRISDALNTKTLRDSMDLDAGSDLGNKEVFYSQRVKRNLMEELFRQDSKTVVATRDLLSDSLARNSAPNNKALGVHQFRKIFLKDGDDMDTTAWCPMGDIKLHGGGLIFLENGHTVNVDLKKGFASKAQRVGMTDEQIDSAYEQVVKKGGFLVDEPARMARDCQRRWLIANYEAGDVVLFSSSAIHATTINQIPDAAIRFGSGNE